MSLPLLPPTNETHFTLSGDVTLHPGAAIAPGVVLQADPGSCIIIDAGVCIGMGSVIHAYQGTIHLEQGAILGLQVLLVGSGRIGHHACLGPGVTVFGCDVVPGSMVAAGTLLGQAGRSLGPSPAETSAEMTPEAQIAPGGLPVPPEPDPWADEPDSPADQPSSPSAASVPPTPADSAAPTSAEVGDRSGDYPNSPQSVSHPAAHPPVYGQASLDRLMGMLFPHRQALNGDGASDDGDPS
jgi:carbon dioxide concentrating mechanism protein CcmN